MEVFIGIFDEILQYLLYIKSYIDSMKYFPTLLPLKYFRQYSDDPLTLKIISIKYLHKFQDSIKINSFFGHKNTHTLYSIRTIKHLV